MPEPCHLIRAERGRIYSGRADAGLLGLAVGGGEAGGGADAVPEGGAGEPLSSSSRVPMRRSIGARAIAVHGDEPSRMKASTLKSRKRLCLKKDSGGPVE